MGYRAYHKDTTRYLCFHASVRTNLELFATAASARAAITREHRRGVIQADNFLIAEAEYFHTNIEKKETVTNLMSGKKFEQSVNTPFCCSPASETYWSC